ncbi:hypothetical protein DPMN_106498 [Dreissena polymorpha]|uniref:Uncharacterized protein n=1 Tax=Dreissena polymorpha TaxID=45954 RepID=A0A9D4K527_DREPO|nr:hypothetical protein DPMN_106498 [Dreissena polymorpha]
MDLVCIDFLTLEKSNWWIRRTSSSSQTNHFARYAQAIPTRNQTAQTTARDSV